MSQLGLGILINLLGGNEETVKNYTAALQKVISSLKVEDDTLTIMFEGGTGLRLRDDGQSCCEHRYMTCDDQLDHYVGATFVGAEIADGPDKDEDEYGIHQVQFLKVETSKGSFTVANHNENNGYYCGFSIVAEAVNA